MISAIYIDTFGPVYAQQLFRQIGPGSSSIALLMVYLSVFAAVLTVFRTSQVSYLANISRGQRYTHLLGGIDLATAVFGLILAFLGFLYGELWLSGNIPLFFGIERTVYLDLYGGMFIKIFYKYGILLCFYLGLFYCYGVWTRGFSDYRFVLILILLLVYLVLVGNKFSALINFTSYFLIPVGILKIRQFKIKKGSGEIVVSDPSIGQKQPIFGKAMKMAMIVVLLWGTLYGTYNTLFYTRRLDRDTAVAYLKRRILIEQSEIWWTSYDRVFVLEQYNPIQALRYVFKNPVDGGNTSLYYLMHLDIGFNADKVLETGSQYTGGYPEIVFEVFGRWWGFVAIIILAGITAKLLFILAKSVLLQRYASIVTVLYVVHPFIMLHIGGKMIFVLLWKYYIKVGLMCIALLCESDAFKQVLVMGRFRAEA